MALSVFDPSRLSIVICTKDRPADLACAIASIRASGKIGREAEIVVVEEADAPRDIAGVRYVHLPRRGRGFGYGRNVGVHEAHGELILLIDDDCEAERGWAEALVEPFGADPRVLGVAGAVLVKNCGLIGFAENILGAPGGGIRFLHDAQGRVVPTRYLSTCNCAYRRKTVLEAGGFLEDARLGGEDTLLAERVTALGPCVYTPMAVVYHRPRGRLGAIFRWFVRRGQSEIGLFRATTDRGQFAWYLIRSSWALRILVLLLILVRWPGLVDFVPAGALVYYAALLWRFRFALSYPSHRVAWWVVPFVKFTMDLGAEVGRWKELASRWRA
jgi:GT2 family glycosyltransferase